MKIGHFAIGVAVGVFGYWAYQRWMMSRNG